MEYGLGCADGDDKIGLEQRRVTAERHALSVADVDELLGLAIVDDDASAVVARPGGSQQLLEVTSRRPLLEPAGDEERVAIRRHPGGNELVEHRRERVPTRVALGAGEWEPRRLDHDRHAPRAVCGLDQSRAGDRVAQRFGDRCAWIGDRPEGRGRREQHGVVGERDDGDAGAGDERNALHSPIQPPTLRRSGRVVESRSGAARLKPRPGPPRPNRSRADERALARRFQPCPSARVTLPRAGASIGGRCRQTTARNRRKNVGLNPRCDHIRDDSRFVILQSVTSVG